MSKTSLFKRQIPMGPPLIGALVVGVGGFFAVGGIAVLAGVATFILLAVVGLVRAG